MTKWRVHYFLLYNFFFGNFVNFFPNNQVCFSEVLDHCQKMSCKEKKVFAKEFTEKIIFNFYPRAKAIDTQIFTLFAAQEIGEMVSQILVFFNEKDLWFYFSDTKTDMLPKNLVYATDELEKYLQFVESHFVQLDGHPINSAQNNVRKISLKNFWLKSKSNSKLQDIYYDLVLINFCYIIKNVAAIFMRHSIDHLTLFRLESYYKKALDLLHRLDGTRYQEPANNILKHYKELHKTAKENSSKSTPASKDDHAFL